MGGGGGGGRSFSGDLKGLEEKAKKELEKGGKPNTFLSFDFDDINEVNLLRGQPNHSCLYFLTHKQQPWSTFLFFQ